MPENLDFNTFVLAPEASTNDGHRPGSLVFEYHEETVTLATNEATVEVTTKLGEVLGLIDLSYCATGADPTDTIKLVTDGVITTSAVTVNAKSVDIADGAVTVRFLFVGKKADTNLTFSYS